MPRPDAHPVAVEVAIDTVVFDVGNVLLPWRPETLYEKLIECPEERAWFLTEVCPPVWNLEQDRGRPIAEAVAARVALFPEQEALIQAYYARWPEMLGEPIAGSVALLYELKAAGLRLYALTNFSAELFPYALARFSFFECFDGIVMSGQEKRIKPEAAIYHCLFSRYGVAPERSVFIDDSVVNVEASRALGMPSVHFQDATSLRRTLFGMGLPVMETEMEAEHEN